MILFQGNFEKYLPLEPNGGYRFGLELSGYFSKFDITLEGYHIHSQVSFGIFELYWVNWDLEGL